MAAEIDWPPLIELAEKVSYEVAAKWSVVEPDDVKQEILLHAMEEKERIAEIQDDEDLLRRIFWTAGRRYASKERDYHDRQDGQYIYTPHEARLALRSFLFTDEELSHMMGLKDDLLGCRITDTLVTARIDASTSMKRLSKRYQEVLYRCFVYGLPARSEAERRMSYRAADALAAAMNRTLRIRSRDADYE